MWSAHSGAFLNVVRMKTGGVKLQGLASQSRLSRDGRLGQDRIESCRDFTNARVFGKPNRLGRVRIASRKKGIGRNQDDVGQPDLPVVLDFKEDVERRFLVRPSVKVRSPR